MKKCKNCSRCKINNTKSRAIQTVIYSSKKMTQSQYGIPNILSSPQIKVYNDDYMLAIVCKTHKKTNKLQKQVKKVKHELKQLQKSVEHMRHEYRNSNKSQTSRIYIQDQNQTGTNEQDKSRVFSVNTSKNRQVGRFTRVSQRQSRSSSKNSLHNIQSRYKGNIIKSLNQQDKNYQQPEIVSFSKQQSNKFKQQSSRSRQDIVKNQDTDDNAMEMYLPSYQRVESSQSSNLLENNDESEIEKQRTRLQRQFEDLILKEKNADQPERKVLRKQIKAISDMIASLSD